MAEYVEQSLERLLPLFEQLKTVKLMTGGEVNMFIKRCRRFDYRCTKMRKNPNDFLNYAEYMEDMLLLIKKRRQLRNYQLKFDQIEGPLQGKVSELYVRLCSRFPGRLDLFHRQVKFLRDFNMFGILSRAYTRVLQFHGKNVAIREESARFEFFENNSAENARSQLQLGLRTFPKEVNLWAALFDVEINYVKRLFERRQLLLKKEETQNPDASSIAAELATIQDAVFQFKLAEIVRDQALQSLETDDLRNEFLFKCWESALKCGDVAVAISDDLYERLKESKSEYFAMTKIHEATVAEDGDVYSAYDSSVEELPTEKMHGLYITYLLERIAKNDPYAAIRLGELIMVMENKGFGEQSDYENWIPLTSLNEEDIVNLCEKLLKKFSSSEYLWNTRLHQVVRMAEKEADALKDVKKGGAKDPEEKKARHAEIRKNLELFNTAQSKLRPEELLSVWQLALDYMLIVSPRNVDSIFESAFLEAPPCVSGPLKSNRLRYLETLHPLDADVVRKEYKVLAAKVPTTLQFHKDFIDMEIQRGTSADHAAICEAFETCIGEFGYSEIDCWISYAKYAIKHKPEVMSQLKTRAEIALPKEKTSSFEAEWILVMQGH